MPDIVLATLNAKYLHAAIGLRYLLANLGDLAGRAELREFTVQDRVLDVAEELLALNPRILGLGVYIWNVAPTTELVRMLKRLRPNLRIVLGGPEVSYETTTQAVCQLADHVIPGEADLLFGHVCRRILAGDQTVPAMVPGALPALEAVRLPYGLYTDEDIRHRVLYVEASRGCPFTCEFCLSSLDVPVRAFPLQPFLEAMQQLLDRGARQFKFVDRTFNLHLPTSRAILEFFLQRLRPGLFLHFEMVPDRLPEPLREVIRKFPAGALQFEVGVQTFDEPTAVRISRRQNLERLTDNLQFLRNDTGVHVHADLIAGLPGETLDQFASGFDRLVALRPQEIQVGILKRLRGTPIVRHDAEHGMIYNPDPPYEVLETRALSFTELQELRRFSRYWDLVANSGNFIDSTPLIWEGRPSAFAAFREFSRWLYARLRQRHAIALPVLVEALWDYLTNVRGLPTSRVAALLAMDYRRGDRIDVPNCLRPHLPSAPHTSRRNAGPDLPPRQRRRASQQAPLA